MSEDWSAVALEVAQALGEVSLNKARLNKNAAPTGTPSDPTPGATSFEDLAATETDFEWREIQSGAVEEGDLKLLMAAPTVEVDQAKHTIVWAGTAYQIIKAMPLRPDGATVINYSLHLRP